MALLKIARMGHPVLLHAAEAIADPASREIRTLLQNMVETMEDATGVGLAAPQVYESKRVIIFKSPRERGEDAGAADLPSRHRARLSVSCTSLLSEGGCVEQERFRPGSTRFPVGTP